MIHYFENFASDFLKKDIETEILKSPYWLWQYRADTASTYDTPEYACLEDENTEDSPQLVHLINSDKDMAIVNPLIYEIYKIVDAKVQFQRIKANLLWPNAVKNPNAYHRPHADHGREDAKSLIYYVNDSDGDTVIFKNCWSGEDPGPLEIERRITPKAGSAVLFDSYRYHASTSPTKNIRSVINFIFWPAVDQQPRELAPPPVPGDVPISKGFHKL